MELVPASTFPNLLRTESPSASRRKHDIESADLSDSSSEELLMEPPSPAKSGRISGKQVTSQLSSSSSGEHAVNIDELSSEYCIYIVPDRTRYANERQFTPQVVSIGPIHYHNDKLRANEHLKERYLAEFSQHTGVSLKECYEHIQNRETRLRSCYTSVIDLSSENFVKMVMMDASFLLMVLVYNYFRSLSLSRDQIFGNPQMMHDIRYDILLLENQLPFFILVDFFKLSKFENFLKRKFEFYIDEEAAIYSLSNYFFLNWGITRMTRPQPSRKAEHILDLLRSYLIPEDWTPERKEYQTRNIPNMKELHQAGVKIQVGSEENIFDISFHDGILKVPPLEIWETSQLIFQNILAFELCHDLERIFCDYFQMMLLLTLSSDGTELLIQKGIIIYELANAKDVSTLFQNIGKGNLIYSKFAYSDVIKGLNEYYERDWHKWKATCCDKYFKAPWAICSVSVAIILLLLTITQTVFTILQVVLPK